MNNSEFWKKKSHNYFDIQGELKLTTLHPRIFELIENNLSLNILDFGCGDGCLSYMLGKNKHKVYAVDKSKEIISLAKKKYSNVQTLNFDLVDPEKGIDGYKEIYKKGKFDVIILSLVLVTIEDSEEYDLVLRMLKEVLKDDGKLILADTNPYAHGSEFSTFSMHLDMQKYNQSAVSFLVKIFDGYDPEKKIEFYDFHRPLEEITSKFLDTGFKVKRIEEVYDCIENSRLANQTIRKFNNTIPPFLVIEFEV